MTKEWRIAAPAPVGFGDTIEVASPALAQLLWNRGLRTKEKVEDFLHPSWEKHVHDGAQFRHMPAAVERVFRALDQGEHITVHGDYDADGVTGSTVLITTLREIEKQRHAVDKTSHESCVDFYIPHRDKEGYGLRVETIPKLKARGTKLLVTVDCGIACVLEIALAKTEGIDTIVVDHHQFGETLPDGYLIHPSIPGETYPFTQLAAVGVAFKFACVLLDAARARGISIPLGWEKWLLDLVAIATVTDMVPLIGENRVLETYGLRVLNKTKRVGIRALIKQAALEMGTLDTESVGFGLGPRINAAGRMDHAELALKLMLAETEEAVIPLAKDLERCNRERQDVTKRMMVEAEAQLSSRYDVANPPRALVLWDERWSPALVGLVAGRLLERFARPIVVIGCHEGAWVGSGRSISAYNVTEGIRAGGEGILSRAGGHVQACGFALMQGEDLPLLAERFIAHATEALQHAALVPTLEIEADVSLEMVDMVWAETVESLAPFGEGNRRPMFVSRQARVVAVDCIGATKNHLRLALAVSGGRRVKALGFKQGERAKELVAHTIIDLVYTVAVNEWNGQRTAECRIIDFIVCNS